MDLSTLTAPFAAGDIEWRIGRAGTNDRGVWAMCLAYLTNRAIMERLDDVVGPENWCNEYHDAPAGGVLCGLSIRVGDEWVTKWDGAENTDIDPVKGGLSGAMKRAAVHWGIGRYLYNLPEGWAIINSDGAHFGKTKDGASFRWDPPALPDWALPSAGGKPTSPVKAASTAPTHTQPPSTNGTDDMIDCPKCGSGMWDNRTDKQNPKSPDLKCKDKECGKAIWLESWGSDLGKEIEAAHGAAAIDAKERTQMEAAVTSLSPAMMLRVSKKIDELSASV